MTSDITKAVKVKDMELLLELAKHCAEDLIYEISARYPDKDQVSNRRRERELEPARLMLNRIAKFNVDYGTYSS